MSDYKKPLPEIQPFTEAFWEGTRNNKLLVQTCNCLLYTSDAADE